MKEKQQKWQNFKVRREVIISKYIEIKRTQLKIKMNIVLLVLKRILKKSEENLNLLINDKLRKNRKIWACIKLMIRFKSLNRQMRKTPDCLHMNTIKNKLSLAGVSIYETMRKKALKTLEPFLIKNLTQDAIIFKNRRLFYIIRMMQRRIRDQLAIKLFKVKILDNYWHILLREVEKKATEFDDTVALGIVSKI